MSFGDFLKRGVLAVGTGGISEVARYGAKKSAKSAQEAANNASAISNERRDLLTQGLQEGRERGELLTGQSMEQTGKDTQSIVSQRREMANSPSRAASEIRARGQQTARRTRAAGGSDAQQRQVELEGARAAGVQEDLDKERRLGQFQDLMGNIMSNQSALETGYGQLSLASQYIAPEQREQGLLGDLFQGLGL